MVQESGVNVDEVQLAGILAMLARTHRASMSGDGDLSLSLGPNLLGGGDSDSS